MLLPMAYLLKDLLIIFRSEEDESLLTTLTISIRGCPLFVSDSHQEGLSTWILRPNILELLLHRRMVSLYMWTLDKSFSYVWWWCWTWTSKRKLSLMAVLPGLFLLSITEPLVRTAGFIYSAGEKNHLFTAAVALVMSCYGDGMKSGWLRLTWTKPLSGTNNEWS